MPKGPYAEFGQGWDDMLDSLADWQAILLRKQAAAMGAPLDHAARRDIESGRDWRRNTPRMEDNRHV